MPAASGRCRPRCTCRAPRTATSARCPSAARGSRSSSGSRRSRPTRAAGLPTVTGIVLVSNADNGEPLAMLDARAVTALRTGAAAAVATQELAREDAHTVGHRRVRAARALGGPLHGRRRVRARACASTRTPTPPAASRRSSGGRSATWPKRSPATWSARSRRAPRRSSSPTACAPGQHLNLLGADGPGKAEATVDAVARALAEGRLFCDEWEQASHGGELTGRGRRRARRA